MCVCMCVCCCMYEGPVGVLATDVKVIPDVSHSSLLIAYFFSIPLFSSYSFAFILSLSFTLFSYIFISTTSFLLISLILSTFLLSLFPSLPFLVAFFSSSFHSVSLSPNGPLSLLHSCFFPLSSLLNSLQGLV